MDYVDDMFVALNGISLTENSWQIYVHVYFVHELKDSRILCKMYSENVYGPC